MLYDKFFVTTSLSTDKCNFDLSHLNVKSKIRLDIARKDLNKIKKSSKDVRQSSFPKDH